MAHLTPMGAALLAELKRVARRHDECPNDEELAERIGAKNGPGAQAMLRRIEIEGHVDVERLPKGQRVVTINKTGEKTALPAEEAFRHVTNIAPPASPCWFCGCKMVDCTCEGGTK